MIWKLVLENYRCFRQAQVRFGPLTALVGPNASGKTTILRALEPRRLVPEDVWRRRGSPTVECYLSTGQNWIRTARPPGSPPYDYRFLRLNLDALRKPNDVEEATSLGEVGQNLTNVFAGLPRSRQQELVTQFRGLVPVFADIHAKPGAKGTHRLVFQDAWAEEVWYEPHDVSDGSLLVLAFLLLQHEKRPADVVAIEEPERGIHPYLLEKVVGLLRAISRGEIGPKATQFVLASHSPQLLEYMEPGEVRFLSRDADGAVTVREAPTSSPEWERAFEEYAHSLGEAWLSGGLGGVPGS